MEKNKRPTPDPIRKPISIGAVTQFTTAEAPDVPKRELRLKVSHRKPVSIGEIGEAMPNGDEQRTYFCEFGIATAARSNLRSAAAWRRSTAARQRCGRSAAQQQWQRGGGPANQQRGDVRKCAAAKQAWDAEARRRSGATARRRDSATVRLRGSASVWRSGKQINNRR